MRKPMSANRQESSPSSGDTKRGQPGGKLTVTKDEITHALNFLQQNGCTRENLLKVASEVRAHDPGTLVDIIIKKFLNAERQADRKLNEIDNNVPQWLKLLDKANFPRFCQFEAAVVINAIVNHEPQPDPKELSGINMTEAYNFLELALTGQPQNEISEATRSFLRQEFAIFLSEPNSDYELQIMQKSIENFPKDGHEGVSSKCSLDPFLLDSRKETTK